MHHSSHREMLQKHKQLHRNSLQFLRLSGYSTTEAHAMIEGGDAADMLNGSRGKLANPIAQLLAMAIRMHGYSETEARQAMVEGGDAASADEWISKLNDAGYFSPPATVPVAVSQDGGSILWNALMQELSASETDFKCRIAVMDNVVKGNISVPLEVLSLETSIKFLNLVAVQENTVQENHPWHGCKFVAMTVLHLVSHTDAQSKRDALRPVCHSLGGCVIPASTPLGETRWPYVLSHKFRDATLAVQTRAACISLHISVIDVELMRNPAKPSGGVRPGTFAHTCVMTISPAGVYLYQGYGPRGYTLLQHMQKHHSSYPMSISDAEAWVQRFEEFAAELRGGWTAKVNRAYAHCFDVDLVEKGIMRLGSQLDLYTTVYALEFSADLVQQNLALLPLPDMRVNEVPCLDGVDAHRSNAHPGYIPNGDVKQYYVPVVLRCGNCGADGATRCCRACKALYYCSKACQKHDWKHRHKAICQTFPKPR